MSYTNYSYSVRLIAACSLLMLLLGESLVVAQPSSEAASYDQTFFQDYEWRNIGPNRGGRSLAVDGISDKPNVYYFGATGGGLWKTTDGGANWFPVTDGELNSSSVGAVDVSNSDSDVVYIGMGEVQLRGSITQGDGVYKSTDGGETWEHKGLEETQAIGRVRVHPTNPDIVYVAALGHPYGDNEERGVFRSTDGGDTWEKVLYVSEKAGSPDLIIDPNNPEVLYASIWQVYRKSWKMWGAGPESGLYKSTDGGDTWEEITHNEGMPEPPIGKIGITVSPVDSDRLWAIVEAAKGGVFRSDDGGQTWTRTNDERKIRQRHFYYSRIYADPEDRNTVYALNTDLYKSTDGGETFDEDLEPPHGDQHDFWLDPNNSDRIVSANDGGGSVSTNGGDSWTEYDFPTAQLYNLTVTNYFPYHACSGQQDNSTVCVPTAGWDHMKARGPDPEWYYAAGGGESGWVRQHPENKDIFYSGTQGAFISRYNRSNGQIRDIQPYPRFFSGEPANSMPERWQWTFPIVFSKHDSETMYISSQHVWKTTDDGQSWERISPDLTRNDPRTTGVTGGLVTMDMNGPEIYATVFDISPSHHEAGTVWTGSDDGKVHITRNGGDSWEDITPEDMPKYTRISILEQSPHNPGTAYIAGNRYQVDDRQPYVWKTDDYGQNWEKITTGIEPGHFARSVREDPKREGLLYLATEHGVYVSFNDGQNWQSLQLNLPDTPVRGLSVTENDLVIATHGRGYWVLDDINPLREYNKEIKESGLTLFDARDAVRGILTGNSWSTAAGESPFYYYLSEEADSVKVEISDSNGNLVRSFVGTEPGTSEEEAEKEEAEEEDQHPEPTTKQGLNRFEWNMLYPGATTFEGMVIWRGEPGKGPMAPPGQYEVSVTALGQNQTSSFEIKMDPRIEGVSENDLQEQYELASKVMKKTDQANKAVIKIREVRGQLNERLDEVDDDLRSRINGLIGRLSSVEKELYQVRNESGQDPLNFPIKINNRLAHLRQSIETGDNPPTDPHYHWFNLLSEKLEVHLSELDNLIDDKLSDINEDFISAGMEAVSVE